MPRRVLELGCGQALPGLVALLAGAEVHFQVRWHPRPSTQKALPGLVAMLAGAEVHFHVRWYSSRASLHPHAQSYLLSSPWLFTTFWLVNLQDYNRAVIEAVTARNVAANLQACQGPSAPPRARYFAGGWAALPALLQGLGLGGAYDAVLSAETLYCQASHAALYQCILHVRLRDHHLGCM